MVPPPPPPDGVAAPAYTPPKDPVARGALTHPDVHRYDQVNADVLKMLGRPGLGWWLLFGFAAAGVGVFLGAWGWQLYRGIGVAGITSPVGWGVYITTFVFWVGIAHSGTLISAILFLFRAPWRQSIYRAAEAMTVFAVMTAGLFPLIHVGRLWHAYWLIPYPNSRFLWPNFKSPLVWDVFAITTYFTVSRRSSSSGPSRTSPRRATARRGSGRSSTRSSLSAGRVRTRSGTTSARPTSSSPRSRRPSCSRCTPSCPGTSRCRSCPAGTRRSSRPTSSPARSSRGSRW
jgi:hypothetical protein